MRRLAVGLAVVGVLAVPAAASADGLTGTQLRSLATRAQHDPSVRARLAHVDRVDGRSFDLGRAMRGATGARLQARLRIIIAAPIGTRDAGDARRAAERVLSQQRFHASGLPRPLHRPLAWLGRRLQPLGRPLGWLGRQVGSATLALSIFGIVVALFALVLAFVTAQRRRAAAEILYFPGSAEAAGSASPAELERLATQRERDGDFEGAVRLRFRAGLLLLDRARAIRYRPSLTTTELARVLRSDDFDGVARDFDEIVYGGRPAAEEDARAARVGWQRVLDRVRGKSAR